MRQCGRRGYRIGRRDWQRILDSLVQRGLVAYENDFQDTGVLTHAGRLVVVGMSMDALGESRRWCRSQDAATTEKAERYAQKAKRYRARTLRLRYGVFVKNLVSTSFLVDPWGRCWLKERRK